MSDEEHTKPGACSVAEFARRFGISRSQFYVLQKQGRGPRTMKIGARTLISNAAGADWVREMEAKTAEALPTIPRRPIPVADK
jgi:transposase-like protein